MSKLQKEDLIDLRILFALGRKAYAEHKEMIEGLLKLEDKVLKILENGKVQSTTNKRTGSKGTN